MSCFAVFGNPIEHSKSPYIYSIFAKEHNISPYYDKILANMEDFEKLLKNFFDLGGLGANITMPFKVVVCNYCHYFTERAKIIGAINVLKKQSDGLLLGDNTDGIGLLSDLYRLGWLHKNSEILLIGSGGAARGVAASLLMSNYNLTITNRTFSHAKELENIFRHIGNIVAVPLDNLYNYSFNLIINATTSGLFGNIPDIPSILINSSVFCYDLFYHNHDTPFIIWCKKHGCMYYSDGLGMLVEQAAYSFLLWHGILPSTRGIIQRMRFEFFV